MKKCIACGEEKDVGEFDVYKKSGTVMGRCRVCYREYQRRYYKMRSGKTLPKHGVKKCRRCGEVRPLSEYNPFSLAPDGLRYQCNSCRSEESRVGRERRRAKMDGLPDLTDDEIDWSRELECYKCGEVKGLRGFKVYRSGVKRGQVRTPCRECSRRMEADWLKRKREKKRKKREAREAMIRAEFGDLLEEMEVYIEQAKKDNLAEYQKKRAEKLKQENPEEYRRRNREAMARQRKKSVQFRLASAMRSRVRQVLRQCDGEKSAKTLELLGCSMKFFRSHIEAQFQEGMTWENYGADGWHLDHIYPCCGFDLTDPEQQRQCFNWSNYQPLWASDNARKSGTVEGEKPVFGV